MNNILIEMEILSKNTPYKYKGQGKRNKDLILFDDKDNNYIFDLKMKRLTKTHKKEKIVVDFSQERIEIDSDGIEIDIKISLVDESIKEEFYSCKYKLDREEIYFVIKYEVV